jgi:hypothetical protein
MPCHQEELVAFRRELELQNQEFHSARARLLEIDSNTRFVLSERALRELERAFGGVSGAAGELATSAALSPVAACAPRFGGVALRG